MNHPLKIISGCTLLLFLPTAFAEVGFRCGTHLIDVGDPRDDVLEHCGEPTSREGGYTWIYDRGPTEFKILVHFEPDGTVNRIENADDER